MTQQQHHSSSGMMYTDYEEKERLRFQIELEFVQCLANPNYLNFLAQRGYFKERNFINYLKYLHSYWTKPAYVKYLKYPLCLHFLELLQHEEFRKEIVNGQVKLITSLSFIPPYSIALIQSYHFTQTVIKLNIMHWKKVNHCFNVKLPFKCSHLSRCLKF